MSEELGHLLDELEETLVRSGRLPFFRRLLVDEERAVALLDRLRAAIPEEIRRAQQVLRERDQILEQARRQAQRIAEQAQQEASMRLEEEGLLEEAEKRSARIVEEAQREAEKIRRGADAYARDVLLDLEARLNQVQQDLGEALHHILASVRKGLDSLREEAS